jgi:hypothetical protein
MIERSLRLHARTIAGVAFDIETIYLSYSG